MVIAMPVTAFSREPLLRVRNDNGGPITSLEQTQKELAQREEVEEEEEQLPISQLRVTREGLEPTVSIVPLATLDPKGKRN